MTEKQTLKQQLPSPYDQDLSQVLRRLDRRTPASRDRLANDPVTAAYLMAAMRLIERHLGPGAERTQSDPEDESSIGRPLLSFLSQRAVAAEVANNPHPFPVVGSVPTLRSTWRSHSHFIADLLRFGLWSRYQPTHCDVTEAAHIIGDLLEGPRFVPAVQELGYCDLVSLIDRPKFRLELLAIAAAEGDEAIREALAENYHGLVEPWREVCAEILKARSLRLRSGVELDDLVGLLTAATEGIALRALIDPGAGVLDHANRRSLLGTAILALILGCTERVEDPPGLPIERAVGALVGSAPGL
ncbi:TetR family transcriptional regulator C-terminal domain-containing protein [Sphaerisporangium sp. TRM90804]|uniref:TetR family transcriptional regulator C-terminal domain-containing protein n=1 Tax=Sphaerisporangium sp. TRM90804 TaxID=3031113 RepID=UPI00244AF20A|nr:TetR family transcriptional regulator C-terminal domain-containing protein [Sphaerisporangium sp. TRM90804]